MKRGNSGMTLVETLIATALVTITAMGAISAVRYLQKAGLQSVTRSNADKLIEGLLENVSTNLTVHQVNFNPSESINKLAGGALLKDKYLNPNKLPMAWAEGIYVPASECPNCPGRFGYLVQPFTQNRGLYLITLRVKHDELFGKGNYKDFEFLVVDR